MNDQTKIATPTILHIGPWGYSMTLNNFYVLLSETKCRARVREIGSRTVEATGFLAGYEVPAFDENVNNKEYTIMRKELPDGSIEYRGTCGMHRTFTLKPVLEGQRFSFNHCD